MGVQAVNWYAGRNLLYHHQLFDYYKR